GPVLAPQGSCTSSLLPQANYFNGSCNGTTNEWQLFTNSSLTFDYNSYSGVGLNITCIDLPDVVYVDCGTGGDPECPNLIDNPTIPIFDKISPLKILYDGLVSEITTQSALIDD